MDPATGFAPHGVAAQTEQVFRNIASILEAAGSSLDKVVRCGVFVADMDEFGAMNEVYERMFAGHQPARSTIQPQRLPGKGFPGGDRRHRGLLGPREGAPLFRAAIAAADREARTDAMVGPSERRPPSRIVHREANRNAHPPLESSSARQRPRNHVSDRI